MLIGMQKTTRFLSTNKTIPAQHATSHCRRNSWKLPGKKPWLNSIRQKPVSWRASARKEAVGERKTELEKELTAISQELSKLTYSCRRLSRESPAG